MKKTTLLLTSLFACTLLFAQLQSDNPMKTGMDSIVDKAARAYMKDSARVGLSIGYITAGKSYMYNYGETAP